MTPGLLQGPHDDQLAAADRSRLQDLPHARSSRPARPRPCGFCTAGWRDRRYPREIRIRQIDISAHPRRPRAAERRHRPISRAGRDRAGPRHRYGVPELCAVSVADGARQCRARPRGAGHLRLRAAPARGRGDRRHRARWLRKRLSEGIVGRDAAARRLCPGARRQPGRAVARRAVFVARRADRGNPARRPARPVGRKAHSDQGNGHRLTQHRGSRRDRRPHLDLQQRPRPHPCRDPDPPAAPACRARHRVPSDRRPGLYAADDRTRPRRATGGQARADRHRLSPARRARCSSCPA